MTKKIERVWKAKSQLNEKTIQLMLAKHFNYRMNLLCPNVSWGLAALAGREVDLMMVHTRSGWAEEIEIKVVLSDLKLDRSKWHQHKSNLFKKLWFAIPEVLQEHIHLIPERAGILLVRELHKPIDKGRHVYAIRAPQLNPTARKLESSEIDKLRDLMAMRYWSMTDHYAK